MSQQAKGRVFPKKGTHFPSGDLERAYAQIIATALRGELGGSHQAIKTAMKWTGAKERTVKNWFGGNCGPSGAHLIELIRNSDAVCDAVLLSAGRRGLVSIQKLTHAKLQLEFLLETVRALAD